MDAVVGGCSVLCALERPHPSSNGAVCVVVRSRSTSGQHVFVKSSNSFEGSLTLQSRTARPQSRTARLTRVARLVRGTRL